MEQLINKIHKGECLEFMKQLPDKSIDLFLSDPPYAQEAHGRGIAGKRKIYGEMAKYTNLENDFYNPLYLNEFVRVCKRVNVFLFCGKRDLLKVLNYANDKGYFFYILPLCKKNPLPTTNNTWLHNEFSVHFTNKKINCSNNYSDKIPYFITGNEKQTEHPNEKNIEDIMKVIRNLTVENDIILDCFSGSGTTAVACHNLRRRFICVEKEKKYYDASCRRLEYEFSCKRVEEEHQKQLSLF